MAAGFVRRIAFDFCGRGDVRDARVWTGEDEDDLGVAETIGDVASPGGADGAAQVEVLDGRVDKDEQQQRLTQRSVARWVPTGSRIQRPTE